MTVSASDLSILATYGAMLTRVISDGDVHGTSRNDTSPRRPEWRAWLAWRILYPGVSWSGLCRTVPRTQLQDRDTDRG